MVIFIEFYQCSLRKSSSQFTVGKSCLLAWLFALGWVVELQSLVDWFAAEVGVLSLADLLLGCLGILVLGIEAVDIIELHWGFVSLVTALAGWDCTLSEAGLVFTFDVLNALNWLSGCVSLSLLLAFRAWWRWGWWWRVWGAWTAGAARRAGAAWWAARAWRLKWEVLVPTELFTSGFLFVDNVSVDGFLFVVLNSTWMSMSGLVCFALALSVHQSPWSDKVFSFAQNLVIGSGEFFVFIVIVCSAQATDLVAVHARGNNLGTISVSDQLEISVADFNTHFTVRQFVCSQKWGILSVLSLVFNSLVWSQLVFLLVDVESWSFITVRFDADDLIFSLILTDDDNEFLLFLVSLADEDGEFLAVVLFEVFLWARVASGCVSTMWDGVESDVPAVTNIVIVGRVVKCVGRMLINDAIS